MLFYVVYVKTEVIFWRWKHREYVFLTLIWDIFLYFRVFFLLGKQLLFRVDFYLHPMINTFTFIEIFKVAFIGGESMPKWVVLFFFFSFFHQNFILLLFILPFIDWFFLFLIFYLFNYFNFNLFMGREGSSVLWWHCCCSHLLLGTIWWSMHTLLFFNYNFSSTLLYWFFLLKILDSCYCLPFSWTLMWDKRYHL